MTPLLAVPVASVGAAADDCRRATTSPWPVGWFLALLASAALGALTLVVSWYGAAGEGVLGAQVPWLNAAVVGAVVSGLGNCAWLLRGRRSVGELRRSLIVAAPARADDTTSVVPAADSRLWVQSAGMRRVHRPSCPLVMGKDVVEVEAASGDRCGMCLEAAP